MAHNLEPRAGEPYLVPIDVVRRLEGEFAFVQANAEAGQNHIASMIRQFERMKAPPALIEEHLAIQSAAIHLVISDSPDFSDDYLLFVATPNQGLFIGYCSGQHERCAEPLLRRCCRVLGYEARLT